MITIMEGLRSLAGIVNSNGLARLSDGDYFSAVDIGQAFFGVSLDALARRIHHLADWAPPASRKM